MKATRQGNTGRQDAIRRECGLGNSNKRAAHEYGEDGGECSLRKGQTVYVVWAFGWTLPVRDSTEYDGLDFNFDMWNVAELGLLATQTEQTEQTE